MFRRKDVMLDSLIETVRLENQLASLSVEQMAQAKGLNPVESVCLETEPVLTIEDPERKESAITTKTSHAVERGLYAVAGAVLIFAMIYLGTYIHHHVVSNETATTFSTIESSHALFPHEAITTPHRGGDLSYQTMPYALEQYFLESLLGE